MVRSIQMTVSPLGIHSLLPRCTPGASVQAGVGVYRLEIPPGPAGRYRLAQLDDTQGLRRRAFNHRAPCQIELKARASHSQLPGTWGFGLWNDPFGISLPGTAGGLRLPALPNAAWFFHASEQSYLTLEDDQPGSGWLAAVFRSPGRSVRNPARTGSQPPARTTRNWFGRLARRTGRLLVRQDSIQMDVDPSDWRTYRLEWQSQQVRFWVDDGLVMETPFAPRPPLGLVIWIDNQFLSFRPDGSLQVGAQANPEPAWIEIAWD
jgi:hypothetical protein